MYTTKNLLNYYSLRLIRFPLYQNILSPMKFYLLKIFVFIFISLCSGVLCKMFCSILNQAIRSVPVADLFERQFDIKAGTFDLCRLLQKFASGGFNGKYKT